MKRLAELDYIRVLAVFMILLCHYLEYSGLNIGLGRYLGGTGNTIFFLLSALLYSYKYNPVNKSNANAIDYQRFAKKRIVKLGSSVWPFLVLIIVSYLIFGIVFSWSKIGLNFLFLSYLAKMPGISHLWFITVLVACYVEFMLLVRFKPERVWFPWAFLVLMYGLMFLAESKEFPGHTFGILGLYGLMFLRGKEFYQMAKSFSIMHMVLIIMFNGLSMWLLANGLFEKSRVFSFFLTDICGLSLLALMLRYMPMVNNRVITFLSGISFEIYIVHFNLCSGPFVRITSWQYSHLLQFGLIVVISIGMAWLLHYVAGKVEKPLIKVFNLNKQ